MDTLNSPARWVGGPDGWLELLDQRLLPAEERWVAVRSTDEVTAAIRDMLVRGAPAIGVTAAYGVVIAAQEVGVDAEALRPKLATLADARPTAVNLAWALRRMEGAITSGAATDLPSLWAEADAVRTEDLAANQAIGDNGAALLPEGGTILTVCNAGGLATAGYGTAVGVLRSAWTQGRIAGVFACETRPYLQGARLTMWELLRAGVDARLVTDGMPGHLMAREKIHAVVTGADRIAANGDTANKIGTYQLAVLARHHGLPFYIAAPISTVDLGTAAGDAIPIEQRSSEEVTQFLGTSIAPTGTIALHPAFDVTPANLITGIITERGVARPPYTTTLATLCAV